MVAEPDVDIAGRAEAEQATPPVTGWPRLRAGLLADNCRLLRRLAYLIYGLLCLTALVLWGTPQNTILLFSIVLVLLLASRIGHGVGSIVPMLIDWIPFVAVLVLYDQTRRLESVLHFPLHEGDLARFDSWLFDGTHPSVWLQHELHPNATVHWYDAVCTLIYSSHFGATPVLAAVLWLARRELWLKFITRVIAMSVAALATYVVFPSAPPWLASEDGYLAPVHRISAEGWIWLHAANVNSLLAREQNKGSNPVAAMPSVHTAMAVLVAIGVASLFRSRSRWRWLLALYPVAMGFTLVYDGEHWTLDVVVGAVYALITHLVISRWESRRAARGLGPWDPTAAGLRLLHRV